MAANDGFPSLLLNDIEDLPASVLPFDLGVVVVGCEMPFDMLGTPPTASCEMPFWIIGGTAVASVMPFDLGDKVIVEAAMPFDILGPTTPVLPPVDLGDGDLVAGTPKPTYGWWSSAPDSWESLGPMETD